ncbi:MAG: hypothetical protein WC447_03270 [Candidatus Paceibacterota bacterium]
MEIIISHDIDHLSVREHILKDLIIPKYIFRSFLELVNGRISLKIFTAKISGLFKKNAWNNLEELLIFDRENSVDSTFFVATSNGKGLSYSKKQAGEAISLIKRYSFDVALHGICYDNYEKMRREYEDFKNISGLDGFGIRMHYLRLNDDTLKNLARIGYLFDSSVLSGELDQTHKIDGIAEIPFHLMDSYLFDLKQNLNLAEAKNKTAGLLDKAEKENKRYVSILFHQEYFSEEFLQYKKWYVWLINYCKEKGYKFINFRNLYE